MRWPWQKVETRSESSGFSDLVIAGLYSRAAGERLYTATATAAVEAAAVIWSAVLAGATVKGSARVREAVTRRFLALTGREWIRRGEMVHVLTVGDRGRIELLPASSWDVNGGPSPRSWVYRADVFSPSSVDTVHVGRAGIVHSQWATNSEEPWRGRAPWSLANLSSGLLTALERRLGQEADMPTGALLPVPQNPKPEDAAVDPLDKLKKGIGDLEGSFAVVETTASGWGKGMSEAPRHDWRPSRLGADPPATLQALRRDAHESILGACGVPVSLLTDRDGTAMREALRRFVTGVVEAKAHELADVLSEALDDQVEFSFRSTWAHDLMGRTGAYSKLVSVGMDPAQARVVSGLEDV